MASSHRIQVFRITKTSFLDGAFSGEGARLYGGRWNSKGTKMVYLAGSLSAATLELLVHTDDYSFIEGLYSFITVSVPHDLVEDIDESALQTGWDSYTPTAASQEIGDHWIKSQSSLLLRVPSAITVGEYNYLCNPDHVDFNELVMGKPSKLLLDKRLYVKNKKIT